MRFDGVDAIAGALPVALKMGRGVELVLVQTDPCWTTTRFGSRQEVDAAVIEALLNGALARVRRLILHDPPAVAAAAGARSTHARALRMSRLHYALFTGAGEPGLPSPHRGPYELFLLQVNAAETNRVADFAVLGQAAVESEAQLFARHDVMVSQGYPVGPPAADLDPLLAVQAR
jgi:hypothetical protein